MMVVTELPFRVGFKKLLSKNYPARNLYTLDFNKDAMFEKLGEQKKVEAVKETNYMCHLTTDAKL